MSNVLQLILPSSFINKAFYLLFCLFTLASCSSAPDSFSIAVAGDWDDHWGKVYSKRKKHYTHDSMAEAGKDDLIVLVGDLSYGRDKLKTPQKQAQRWCDIAKEVSNNTPMIFVPGDHDSKAQDGDIATYEKCLTPPRGDIGAPQTAGYGMYPYLYYVDVKSGGATLRIVATSIAFQEEETEPKVAQKYFKGYEKGQANYNWLKATYQQARENNYWIIHVNHLPCIDMGKNQNFGQGCQDIVNLDIESGVNILLTGSSHNIWRTYLLRHSKHCPQIPLTHKANGANPICAYKNNVNTFKYGEGLVQAHAGAGGKTSASKVAIPCDPRSDGEAAHYLAPKTCGVNNVAGFVRLNVSEHELKASYILTQHDKTFKPYEFKFIK